MPDAPRRLRVYQLRRDMWSGELTLRIHVVQFRWDFAQIIPANPRQWARHSDDIICASCLDKNAA
jgi:hypothetical protein